MALTITINQDDCITKEKNLLKRKRNLLDGMIVLINIGFQYLFILVILSFKVFMINCQFLMGIGKSPVSQILMSNLNLLCYVCGS